MDLSYFFYPLFAYLFAILAHEVGHIVYFDKIGIKAELRFNNGSIEVGSKKDYNKLNNKQYKELMLSGIVLGLIPIIITALATNGMLGLFILAMLIPYLLGAASDIKQVLFYE